MRLAVCAGTVFLAALPLLNCSAPATAGNTSSETTNGITISGTMADSAGNGIDGVAVVLLKVLNEATSEFRAVDTVYTDESGAYAFKEVPEGSYFIRSAKSDAAGTSSRIDIAEETEDLVLDDVMTQAGGIAGIIDVQTSYTVEVRLEKTPYITAVETDGSFLLESVEPGRYLCEVMIGNDSLEARILIYRDSVTVTAGNETVMDTVRPEQFGNGDSLVMYSDFENGKGQHINYEGWWSYVDSLQNGTSTINSDFAYQPGAEGSQYCARSTFTFGESLPSFVGIGSQLGYRNDPVHYAYDFSRLRTVSLRIKGTANTAAFQLISKLEKDSSNLDKTTLFTIDSIPADWSQYTINVADAVAALSAGEQARWYTMNRFIHWITITYTRGGGPKSGEIYVDDIQFEFH